MFHVKQLNEEFLCHIKWENLMSQLLAQVTLE